VIEKPRGLRLTKTAEIAETTVGETLAAIEQQTLD